MNQFSPRIYWLSPYAPTDRPILGAVAGREATLLVDAGASPAHARQFLEELSRLPIAPPRFLVLTHRHGDHVFGADTINLPTFASVETRQRLEAMAAQDWTDAAIDQRVSVGTESPVTAHMIKAEMPERASLAIRLPEIVFRGQVDVHLGGLTCQIIQVGGDHDPGSTVVYVPEEKVMFLGDCLCTGLKDGSYRNPPIQTAVLFTLFDRLLAYDVNFYFEAHQEQPTSRQALIDYRRVCEAAQHAVQRSGADRPAVLAELQAQLSPAPYASALEEAVDMADAFLAAQQ